MTTTGNCFRCHEPGHWISDCPLKINADPLPPPSIHCTCGGGFCLTKVANTQRNPGRKFYKCPTVRTFAQDCGFFKWCDKVTDEDIRFRPAFMIPICPCGSGLCRKFIADSGPDSGRAYYLCCIKKGFGACGYFQWEGVEMGPICDVVDEDEMDFWVEADLISSDVESNFHASVMENVNQVAVPGKECHGSVSIGDDSIVENLDAMLVSDIHSHAALNQGIPLIGPRVAEEQVAVVIEPDEPWMKTMHVDHQATNSAPSKLSFKESCHLNLDEALSDLGSVDRFENVGDAVSSGSVVTNHEQPGTGETEWSSPNLQDIIEQYNSEKHRLESVSGKHVQVLSAFMGSYRRLRLLHEKTNNLRKLLLETEKEMACCEAETLELGASCREVASEMAESQKRMQETAEKLGKEVDVLKLKEFVTMKRRKC
ncbi:unnamed protein product [Arabis nemorensis]|uniref:Uncharacterized protein n=1 Tax=Arabis nemorensis TaxID=586526 RepID=A0A565CL49_9BRAS|nr:unnamed protein product [Arabis nemorensis]